MIRSIIIVLFALLSLQFTFRADREVTNETTVTVSVLDTVPIKVTEALIEELTRLPNTKTWRDSGYYFRFETVNWIFNRFRTAANGDALVLASFSSADPSSLNFRGSAVFRFDRDDIPSSVSLGRGLSGQAMIAFPLDVLMCPSPAQEVGLGENDPYFPLYLSGELTSADKGDGGEVIFQALMSVQLRSMEVIM